MKRYSKPILWMLCFIFLATSCTIEKRRYLDGFHVEWKHRNKNNSEIQNQEFAVVDTINVLHKSVASAEIKDDTLMQSALHSESSTNISPAHELIESNNSTQEHCDDPVYYPKYKNLKQIIKHGVSGGISNLVSAESTNAPTPFHDLNKVGLTFSTIGLIFAVLAITFLIIGIFIAVDWAALGYVILAIMAAGLSGFFAWIAQGIFWHHKQGVPVMQWPGLILGLLGLYALIRIIFKI